MQSASVYSIPKGARLPSCNTGRQNALCTACSPPETCSYILYARHRLAQPISSIAECLHGLLASWKWWAYAAGLINMSQEDYTNQHAPQTLDLSVEEDQPAIITAETDHGSLPDKSSYLRSGHSLLGRKANSVQVVVRLLCFKSAGNLQTTAPLHTAMVHLRARVPRHTASPQIPHCWPRLQQTGQQRREKCQANRGTTRSGAGWGRMWIVQNGNETGTCLTAADLRMCMVHNVLY